MRVYLVLLGLVGCWSSGVIVDQERLEAVRADLQTCHKAIDGGHAELADQMCRRAAQVFSEKVVGGLRSTLGDKRALGLEVQFGAMFRTLPQPDSAQVLVIIRAVDKALTETAPSFNRKSP